MKQKLKRIFEKFIWWSGVITIGIIFGLGIQLVLAWTEPSVAPPGGNAAAPINAGNSVQYKIGALGIGGLLAAWNGFWLDNNGQDVSNKVLTADASGFGSWQSAWYFYAVPTSVITTTATHNGNFGGYQAMYNWIQTNGCSSYHVCDNTELTRYYQLHPADSLAGWQNTGLKSISSLALNDCASWTTIDQFASLWIQPMNASANEAACSEQRPVMCCK